jgi:glutathione synthase
VAEHLYICDHLSLLRPGVDTTLGLARASREAGCATHWGLIGDLIYREGKVWIDAHPFDATHAVEPGVVRQLGDFTVTFVRTDPPVEREYLAGLWLLDVAARDGCTVVNDPASLSWANEKTLILYFPELIPPTRVTNSVAELRSMIEAVGTIVLKPLDGNGGRGVLVAAADDGNTSSMLEMSTEDGRRQVMAQAYLPAVRDGDRRVLLVDGDPHAVLNRVAPEGEHRSNMHVGAIWEYVPLDAHDRRICAAVGPFFRRHGLRFVGLDIIGGTLTEINVTSPTGVEEVLASGGPDVSAAMIAALKI